MKVSVASFTRKLVEELADTDTDDPAADFVDSFLDSFEKEVEEGMADIENPADIIIAQ